MSTDRIAADVAFVKALAELLNENDLTEIVVEREYGESDTLNVKVSKQGPQAVHVQAPSAPAPTIAALTHNGASPAPAAAAASADPAEHPGAVNSPMVGTAYLAPEPGAEPFVSVGDEVAVGQTLMIIEAMKTMNHIPAPHGGTVRRILVADGTPVEYGAPLMIIE
jgi:acetyl-CoA carboxylase biotin carboxyl carrier protein